MFSRHAIYSCVKKQTELVMILLCLIGTAHGSNQQAGSIDHTIDSIFRNYLTEAFSLVTENQEQSGWMMELPSGKMVTRSFLMSQAEVLIKFGKDAVPKLCKWVTNDHLYIRYIAAWSLQQITGLSPYLPYFDKEDLSGNREKAIHEWMDWWKKQNMDQ